MFKVSATGVMRVCRRLRKLVISFKNTPMKTEITLNQLNNFARNFQ